MAKPQRSHLKQVTVYDSREAAMKRRDLLASTTIGLDVIVQSVRFDAAGNPTGFIVREMSYERPKNEIDHSIPKKHIPAFKNQAERARYLRELEQTESYLKAMNDRVYEGRSREPKSIYAEVPVRSISKPKAGSKAKTVEDSAYARTGHWKSDHQGWRKLPRV